MQNKRLREVAKLSSMRLVFDLPILLLLAEDGRVEGSGETDYQRILYAMQELTTAGLEIEYSNKLKTTNRTGYHFVHCGEVMIMAKLGTFPFVPNMDDCKMVVQASGAVCYIMNTCCRNMTQEDKARADQEIVDIYLRSAMRRKAKGSA